MNSISTRPTFQPDNPAVATIVGRLEAGETWDAVAKATGLEALDLLAALAVEGLGGDESLGPPLVQAPPRRPRLLAALGEPALPGRGSRPARLAISAGLLQILDFWDASHLAAQTADDLGERAFSPYWHAIAHRREPDPGNAAYWFRRVGRNPLLDPIAEAAARLGWSGAWNPTAMIEFCARARPGTPEDALARRVQRVEMRILLEATAEALA